MIYWTLNQYLKERKENITRGEFTTKLTGANIMYKTLGFKWLFEVFCPALAFATADRKVARNPQRFIHVSVSCHCRTPDRQFNFQIGKST